MVLPDNVVSHDNALTEYGVQLLGHPLPLLKTYPSQAFMWHLKNIKKIFKEETSVWLLHPNSRCNGTGRTTNKMMSLCYLRMLWNDHCGG